MHHRGGFPFRTRARVLGSRRERRLERNLRRGMSRRRYVHRVARDRLAHAAPPGPGLRIPIISACARSSSNVAPCRPAVRRGSGRRAAAATRATPNARNSPIDSSFVGPVAARSVVGVARVGESHDAVPPATHPFASRDPPPRGFRNRLLSRLSRSPPSRSPLSLFSLLTPQVLQVPRRQGCPHARREG